jgi:hypothetical protein
MTTGRTYHLVTPLDPQVEAAWRARAEVFFAECRAAHDAMVERNVAAVLAAEAAAETPIPQPLRIAA